MNDFAIRRARLEDAGVIARYNVAMALETEHIALDAARTLRGVEAVFADPAHGFYLVAIAPATNDLAGQLMITYEWSDWRNGNFWWIQSVYVHPDFRGRGVYKQLYSAVEQAAAEAGNVCGIRLYVERDNTRAQQVYRRQGMRPTAYDIYEVDFVLTR